MLHGLWRALLHWQVPQSSDPSCSYFTVADIHINSERAKRRSVCIALLFLTSDLCLKLGAVVLTVDFNKGAERGLPPGGSESQRRISPLEAAFSSARDPWPTLGVTPLWSPGDEPHGDKWPECCGFVILPESQSWWSCGTGPLT